jgi:hypothetical protein
MISKTTAKAGEFGFTALMITTLALIICVSVRAQVSGGTLTGTVNDFNGGPIPNAKISVKNEATGVVQETTTDAAGVYSAPNLLPGTYNVTISGEGFAPQEKTGVTLGVGEQRLLNISMQIGTINQQVQVSGVAPTVELATSSIDAQVDEQTIREIPLNGRDWAQLATLQPGIYVVHTEKDVNNPGGRGNRGWGQELTDAGHSPYMNNYQVNGISSADYSNGAPGGVLGTQLGVDAIQEFSVQTTNYGAEYGRSAGAVINAITKSGTNDFHGSAFWFLRDEDFDARNFFDPAKIAPFHRNQFGVSGGGPIKKDKTFVFAAYEGVRQDLGLSFHNNVPTAAARAGNLCSAPSAGGCTPHTVAVDPKVQPFLALYPLPNAGSSPGGNGDIGFYDASGSSPAVENYTIVRVDHHFSEKDTIAASYTYDKSTQTIPDSLLLSTNNFLSERQLGTLEWDHTFGSKLVNSARIGYNRPQEINQQPGTALNPIAKNTSLAAVPGMFPPVLEIPSLTTMQGGLGSEAITNYILNSYQVYDDMFLSKGKHTIKFGLAVENMRTNLILGGRNNGDFAFPSLEGFLLNEPTSFYAGQAASLKELGGRQTAYGFYVNDDWHFRQNLTFNIGLRYEPATIPIDSNNQLLVLKTLSGPIVHTNPMWDSNGTLRNFQPRLGFSWDPFKDGKTALRGGFGLYDILPLEWEWAIPTGTSYPFSFTVAAGNLPPGSFPTGALSLIGFNVANAAARYVTPNPKRAYSSNWNLNLERQITRSVTLTAAYVGSHSVHLPFKADDENMVLPTLTSAGYLWPYPVGSGAKLNPNVGAVVTSIYDTEAHYEGFLASVRKTFTHGVQAQGSYTHGKCFDTGTTGTATDPFQNTLQNPMFFSREARYGPCDYDVRNLFVGNFLWQLPKPTFGGSFAETVLGGWAMSGVVTFSSGTPFSVLIGGDSLGEKSSGTFNFPDRSTTAGCQNPINTGNPNNYLKLNCFLPPIAPASFAAMCQPAAASVAAVIPNTCMNLLGDFGKNSIYGPGIVNFDYSLTKDTYIRRISETFDVQLRAEFFNIFNHANFQSPVGSNTVLNQDGTPTAGAGTISSTTTTSRQIQFALKLIW